MTARKGMSERIEAFINELMKEEDKVQIQRNELAEIFNCVPSQINYVIGTRFSPERGYEVESRRGGGGYIRIRRLSSDAGDMIYSTICQIGNSLGADEAKGYISNLARMNIINDKTAKLILSAVSDRAIIIQQPEKDILRANILKTMLTAIE